MYIFILYKFLLQILIHHMRLMRIGCPSAQCIKSFSFQLAPFGLLDHKLSGYFIPPLLPIHPCIQNHDNDIIYSDIASSQNKPIPISHCPELILILNKTIIIKLIFIKRALFIKSHFILWTQLMNGNYRLIYSLNFENFLNFAFERCDEKTVRNLFNFSQLDMCWDSQLLPFFSVLYLQFWWDI